MALALALPGTGDYLARVILRVAGLATCGAPDCSLRSKIRATRAIECVYLRRLMEQVGNPQEGPPLIGRDNNACYLTQGACTYHKAKHIDSSLVESVEQQQENDSLE